MNSGGSSPYSELSEPVETLLTPPGKPRAINITQNSVELEWDSPLVGEASVQSYTILYCSTDEKWYQLKTNIFQPNFSIGDLNPKTLYHFKVRAESSTNSSPVSEASDSVETLLPPPDKPYATNVTHNSVQLSWDKPQYDAGSVQQYTVMYTTASSNIWKEKVFQNSGLSCVYIQDLLPNNLYVFKVRADNTTTSSPESESIRIKTLLPPPGRPYASNVGCESFQLNWQEPEYNKGVMYYRIFYRAEDDGTNQWSLTTANESNCVFTPKCFEKSYVFKVSAALKSNFTDKYSSESETSEPIATKPKPWGAQLISSCTELTSIGNLKVYQLPLDFTLKKKSVAKANIRRLPNKISAVPTKVLMLVGATGAGKTTLINGMANFITGVNWEENFRFKLINEDTAHDQTKSQTKIITAYTFHRDSRSFPLLYNLTVIDTPGFGDTTGLERDKEIVAQIKEFFSMQGEEGIDQLHGIGFVVQAPQARLTAMQRYIYDSILAIFGKDVADNIFLMVTFSDGMHPPVLDAAITAGVPFKKQYFKFNNSALFARKVKTENEFNKMFWKMGQTSFDQFFKQFSKAQTQSLQISREVLEEREHLEVTIQGLQQQICAGLSKIDEIKEKKRILKEHEADIIAKRKFTHEIEVPKQRKVDLPHGHYTTNCLKCNYTCHKDCQIPEDENKYYCLAMVERGSKQTTCKICPQKCIWNVHVNNPYRFEIDIVLETVTSEDLKVAYNTAMTNKEEIEAVMKKMEIELQDMGQAVLQTIDQVRKSLDRLQEIALKPDPLTEIGYIDILIESEKREAQPGWRKRLITLEEVRKKAEILYKVKKEPGSLQDDEKKLLWDVWST